MTGAGEFRIVIEPPDTAGNFKAFNVTCDVLDSDFLMQPINEADYDSETQVCVDTRTGQHQSFYEHFVTKRKKKKGKRVGTETSAPHDVVPRVTVAQPTQDPDRLMPPQTLAVPKGALSNVAVRRIACGRMPGAPLFVSPPPQ